MSFQYDSGKDYIVSLGST